MKTKIERINNKTWVVIYTTLKAGSKKENKLCYVKAKEVNDLKRILTPKFQKYHEIVKQIIKTNKIHTKEQMPLNNMISAFNGGRFRKLYYFPLYYYPMIVLEHEKQVKRVFSKARLI